MSGRKRLAELAGHAHVERETLERYGALVDAGRVHEALARWVSEAPIPGTLAAAMLEHAIASDELELARAA